MIPLIIDNLDQIAALCREYRIQSLAVFGSAATATANEDANDVDLICDLGEYDRGVAWRFFDFAEALEQLFGKKVGNMTEAQIQNPTSVTRSINPGPPFMARTYRTDMESVPTKVVQS